MSKPVPWWLNPPNKYANAIWPSLTDDAKEKAARKSSWKRPDPNVARGFVSPLGGQAKPFAQPQPKRR